MTHKQQGRHTGINAEGLLAAATLLHAIALLGGTRLLCTFSGGLTHCDEARNCMAEALTLQLQITTTPT